ncbi:hypothetical protein IMZ11_39655 [Microtetraspora sp. AC03309]|nr:hypothetical protein [Microtetraspora sp. AC03309]MCC5581736.1 hypothetical protein [Microtetraspora sp. AC03309]
MSTERVPADQRSDDEWIRVMSELHPHAPVSAGEALVYRWRAEAHQEGH